MTLKSVSYRLSKDRTIHESIQKKVMKNESEIDELFFKIGLGCRGHFKTILISLQ